jgi:hypothetical protein
VSLTVGLVALIVLSASPEEPGTEEEPPYVFADLSGGQCVLHNFGKSYQGGLRGHRVWFGNQVNALCSYHAWDCLRRDPAVHVIDVSCEAHSQSVRPIHYGLYTAFFDASGNLIACGGGPHPDSLPTKPPHVHTDPRYLVIPIGVHKDVRSYKTAYYESDLPIGKLACEADGLHTTEEPVGNSADSSGIGESERAGEALFKIRPGSRLILQSRYQNWRAETTEGEYASFEPTPEFGSREDFDESKYAVRASKNLKMDVVCRFTLSKNNAIQPSLKLVNPTDGKLFTHIYLALFDKEGHLVCGTEYGTLEVHPQTRTLQTPTVRGTVKTTTYHTTAPLPVPIGLEKGIASYKITVYESNRLIGEVEMAK